MELSRRGGPAHQRCLARRHSRGPGGAVRGVGRYFQQTLKFPFEAEVAEFMERGRLRVGDIVTVLRIELVDDDYGVIVRCRRGREQIDAPLADLECTDIESDNHDPVKDYAVWFANR